MSHTPPYPPINSAVITANEEMIPNCIILLTWIVSDREFNVHDTKIHRTW